MIAEDRFSNGRLSTSGLSYQPESFSLFNGKAHLIYSFQDTRLERQKFRRFLFKIYFQIFYFN